MNSARLFFWFLVGFSLAFAFGLASAAGTVSSGKTYTGKNGSFWPSATASCSDPARLVGQPAGVDNSDGFYTWYPNDIPEAVGSTFVCWGSYNGGTHNVNLATGTVQSSGGCPVNSTLTNADCVCNTGYQPNQASTACWPSRYCFDTGVSVNGSSSMLCFDTAEQACLAQVRIGQTSTWLGNGVCKKRVCYPDGSCDTIYSTISNTATCPPGDTACLADTQSKYDEAQSAVSSAKTLDQVGKAASAVSAATTAAGDAAASAAAAAGLDASGVAAARTQAEIQAAADTAADQAKITECEANPERLGCMTSGEFESNALGTQERGISSITPYTVGGASSCPPDVPLSFMGHSFSISYSLPCSAATMLHPLVLALSWLAAGYIFIGGVRGS